MDTGLTYLFCVVCQSGMFSSLVVHSGASCILDIWLVLYVYRLKFGIKFNMNNKFTAHEQKISPLGNTCIKIWLSPIHHNMHSYTRSRLVTTFLYWLLWRLSSTDSTYHRAAFLVSSSAAFPGAFRWMTTIDLSTARPKWRLDGPALLGHLMYSLVNHAYANRYYHHLVG